MTTKGAHELGFTLIEVMVALALTLIITGAIFGLLTRAQRSFRREPEVSAVNQSARAGLDSISRDLIMAGYRTPGVSAVLWRNGSGGPDEIAIVYADRERPSAHSMRCGWSLPLTTTPPFCSTLSQTSTVDLDLETMAPYPPDPALAFPPGAVLLAIETEDCNNDDLVGVLPLRVSGQPTRTVTAANDILSIGYQAEAATELNLPSGFNTEVHPNCALVGRFRVVQYRIDPTETPSLQRRDFAASEPWIAVADNVDDLQFQYITVEAPDPVDTPELPHPDFPETWISGVRVSLGARSESLYLEGSSEGPGALEDGYVRRSFSTAVSLRNVVAQASALSLPVR